jgi:hypothetical protein
LDEFLPKNQHLLICYGLVNANLGLECILKPNKVIIINVNLTKWSFLSVKFRPKRFHKIDYSTCSRGSTPTARTSSRCPRSRIPIPDSFPECSLACQCTALNNR